MTIEVAQEVLELFTSPGIVVAQEIVEAFVPTGFATAQLVLEVPIPERRAAKWYVNTIGYGV